MATSDRAAVKRAAQRALAAAAAEHLAPLGFQRDGRSPRYWHADRVWRRLNVWFPPSGFRVATALTVGDQTYWSLLTDATIQHTYAVDVPGFGTGAGGSESSPTRCSTGSCAATSTTASG